MLVDYSITVGNIIEIVSIIGGGVMVLFTLKSDVKMLKDGAESLKVDLESMQTEIKKLGDILVNLADIRGEIRTHNMRLTTVEQDIRELRKTNRG